MEPTEALHSIETVLRLVVREVLGSQWLSAAGAPKAADLRRSHARDQERRDGVVVPEDLLEFTETRQLTALIRANWTKFEPVFADEARTLGFLQVIDDVRYTVAHSRNLVPFERDLLSGIAGQLRQQVALWRNSQAPSTRFFPLIEEVRDNFGIAGHTQSWALHPRRHRLEVGDTITFSCAAFGEQRRPVEWYVRGRSQNSVTGQLDHDLGDPVAVGDQAEVTYRVLSSDIGEDFLVEVFIKTSSAHHRRTHPRHDDVRAFFYAVNPPEDE